MCKYKEKQMANRINSMGGISLEVGQGYRASLTVRGKRIRSQRVKSKKEAQTLLNRIRRALGKELNVNSSAMTNLSVNRIVSITSNT